MAKVLLFLLILVSGFIMLSGAGQQILSTPSIDDQRIAGERMIEDAQRYARGTETAIAALGDARAFEILQKQVSQTEQAAHFQGTQTAVAIQNTAIVENARSTQAVIQTATVQAVVHELTRVSGYLQITADAARIANYQTQVAAEARSTTLTLQREEATNVLMAWLPIGLKIVVFAIVVAILVMIVLMVRHFPRAYPKGNILVYRNGLVDPERATGPVIPVNNGHPREPAISHDPHQAQVTARAQAIEALRAAPSGRTPPTHVFKYGETPAQITGSNAPVSAPWHEIEARSPGKFLLGYDPNARGRDGRPLKIEADPTGPAPHLLMAGTTGSGKTWLGLRPLIAQALGDGYQVIVLNPSGQDYDVFCDIRNARLIYPDDRPEMVTEYLRRIYGEMQRREQILKMANASTWDRMPNPLSGILVVIDEFANLSETLRSINPVLRNSLWAAARQVASSGRKVGTIIALALQNPSRDNIDMSLRRQFTRVAFKVQDRDASQIVLGAVGAEALPEGHFMTIVNGLRHGVGFKPTNDDIKRYLVRHQAPILPPMEWLDIESRPVENEPIEDTQSVQNNDNGFISAETLLLVDKIRDLWSTGASCSEMARAAGYPQYGGSYKTRIDHAVRLLQRYASTPTPDTPPAGKDGVEL